MALDMPAQPYSGIVNQPPPLQTATARDVVKWVNSGIYYGHDLRCRDVSRYRRAELYDQGMQWLRESLGGFEQGNSPAQWAPVYWSADDSSYIPTPVFNEGLGARINESARLGRPNYRPKVTPKSEMPDLASREGSKAMKESLVFSMRTGHWDDKQGPLLYYHMPLYGGAYWKSEFVLRWDQVVTVPVQGAASCPECGKILSDRTIQPQHVDQIGQSAPYAMNAFSGGDSEQPVSLGWCPWCASHPQLEPYDPTFKEAQTGKDVFNRPLGESKPSGDWEMKVCSPYDMFLRNMGLDQSPGELTDVTEAHVEHLDWFGLRWPDKVNKLKPENPAALAREHPVAGAPDLLASMLDARLFENCARAKERHKLPWMEMVPDQASGKWTMQLNQGRSAVVCGDEVLFYGPLMMASANYPGQTLKRVIYDYIPWELRDGGRRLQGLSQWDGMFDPQDAINETSSQTQAVRKRLAVPLYLALTTHNFQIAGMRGGIPGMLAEIDVDPLAPGIIPSLINNTTIDPGVREEMRGALEALQRIAGNIDVEQGNPPPGVSAGNAIAFLKGASSEKREPRLARIKASLKRGWSHGAEIKCHMYAEARPMRYKDEDGEERWKYVHGLDFSLQTDVDVDAEPDFDNEAQEIEKVRDAIQIGVLDPRAGDAGQKRALGRIMKLDESLYEDRDLQDKDAQREQIDYKEIGRMPRIDPGLDDHSTHYQVHGRFCKGAFFRQKELEGHWDDALEILGESWATTLKMVEMLTMMQAQQRMQAMLPIMMQALGSPVPQFPMAAPAPPQLPMGTPPGAQPQPGFEGAPAAGGPPGLPPPMPNAAMPPAPPPAGPVAPAMGGAPGAMPGAPPSPMGLMAPPPPPPGPPLDLQARIVVAWITILTQAGFGTRFLTTPEAADSFKFVAIWRAHIEAHRMEDEKKQMQAAQAPVLAAPGAPTTAAGNMPTEGAPPAMGMPAQPAVSQ